MRWKIGPWGGGDNMEFGGIMSLGQAYLKADIRGLWRTEGEPSIRKQPPLEQPSSPTAHNISDVPSSNLAEIRSLIISMLNVLIAEAFPRSKQADI
jgi:hypothetical protein